MNQLLIKSAIGPAAGQKQTRNPKGNQGNHYTKLSLWPHPKGKVLIDVEDGMHVDVSRHASAPTSRQDTKSIGPDHMVGDETPPTPTISWGPSGLQPAWSLPRSHGFPRAPPIGSHLGSTVWAPQLQARSPANGAMHEDPPSLLS